MDKPKKLILDYSKWRCGEDGSNRLGKGGVALLNKEGYQCCLGQWCQQLGAPPESLLNNGEPAELILNEHIPIFYTQKEFEEEYVDEDTLEYKSHKEIDRSNTCLSIEAIGINDEKDTTPEYKIILLTELLARDGIELEVINKPDIINC